LDGALGTVIDKHAVAQLISPQEGLPTTEISETDFGYFSQIQGGNFDFSQEEAGGELSTCTCESPRSGHKKWCPSLETTTLNECQLRTDVD
jgi:hypothetical protein